MPNLYLDIDGVLITPKDKKIADYSNEFLDYVLENFDCYWLTTHCKGNNKHTLDYLSNYFEQDLISKLKLIKPTNWITLKTEAIDFSSDFYWIDDYPLTAEIDVIKKRNCLDKLIICNLGNKSELLRIIGLLKN